MADSGSSLVELKLLGLQVQVPSQSRLMLLRETSGEQRVLPVVIDDPEAQAIYRGIEKIELPRPLTHDLLQTIFESLDVTIVRVTITEISDHTFFAEIELEMNGDLHVISARPSDAVALAVRSSAAIFASQEVMEEAGQIVEVHSALEEDTTEGGEPDTDPKELLDDFLEFLEDVNPDDFDQPESPPDSPPSSS